MNIVNETPFPFAPFAGKVIFPKDTLTLIVKGTFRLVPESAAGPVEPDAQLPPTGDLFYDDDPQSSCRYPSDFVHYKPKADVLLVGHCHPPGGQPVPASAVRFRAGRINKALMVFGDRHWRRTRLGTRTMSEPEPFTRLPLRYENSFGGPEYAPNPVGKGIRPKNGTPKPSRHAMANIKVLEGEQLKTMPQGSPAGFGPLGCTWTQRLAMAGTYDDKWKNERWPWLPDDFEWGYHNAAPADQQVKGYLKGDEALYFENLHPDQAKLQSKLPGIRVRCFLTEKQKDGRRFREVQTQLDTLWIDMDADRLVLVWRGLSTMASPDGDSIEDLLIVQEPVEREPQPKAHYEQVLNDRKAAAAAPVVEEEAEEEAEEEKIDAHAEAAAMADEEAAIDAEVQEAMGDLTKNLDESTLDPKLVAEVKAEKDPHQFAMKLLQGMDIEAADYERMMAPSLAQAKELLAKEGHDPAMLDELLTSPENLSPQSPPPPPDQEALAAMMASGQGTADQDLTGADFSKMSLKDADFKEAQLEGAIFREAHLADANFSGANLSNADFSGADLEGAIFAGTDVSQSRFTAATLVSADFSEALMMHADLSGANLNEAVMTGAQLGHANLSQATLQKAGLAQADLTNADLTEADLTEADLELAVLDNANLTQADLGQAKAGRASFNGALLLESDFTQAMLEECNFANCRCDHAVFQSAALGQATFEGATGHHVNFREAELDRVRAGENARLPASVFRRARGERGNWSGADLTGADFILAEMPFCDFSQANLTGCDGRTADLKQCVFDKAVMQKARFNRANLFQVRMEAADLAGANFKGCNLYGSEFLDARVDRHTNFDEANLKATKLASLQRGKWNGS